MSTFDLENPEPKAGDELRDEAANLLSLRYGRPFREFRAGGKKVDLHFKKDDFGRELRVYVEAKDLGRVLHRSDLTDIVSDYDGIIDPRTPYVVLVISRRGLSSDAQHMVQNEKSFLRHQTIWELEDDVLGLTEYFRVLAGIFDEEGLSKYYIPSRANSAKYDDKSARRFVAECNVNLVEFLEEWISNDESTPIAILGGYGAGKSSLAKRIVAAQAAKALQDPKARRPILVPLGRFTRAAMLPQLLGGMFGDEYAIEGFNLRRFKALNERGRLLIVLDGFDEMKHAMSSSEFKTQLEELRPLIVPEKSKVILLGRPSAFSSDDEHYEILQSARKFGSSWRRQPNWPQFNEYDLLGFTPEERSEFVRRYLSYIATHQRDASLPDEWIAQRAAEVNQLADQDPAIFEKPVHAKILTELAVDPTVDLSPLKSHLTRWTLYSAFFNALAERETLKEARRPIDASRRLDFMRDLAFWLWSEKGGATAFSSHDLPDALFERAYGLDDEIEPKTAKREFFAGAFLEKKHAEIYYFGHRSFAEYLVAEYMTLHPPSGVTHQTYAALASDGVLAFLKDAPAYAGVANWAKSLGGAIGFVPVDYIALLFELARRQGIENFLPPDCTLSSFVKMLPELSNEDAPSIDSYLRLLRHPSNAVFLNAIWAFKRRVKLQHMVEIREKNTIEEEDIDLEIIAALLDRVFAQATIEEETGKANVPPIAEDALRLAKALKIEVADDYDRSLFYSPYELSMAVQAKASEDIVLVTDLNDPDTGAPEVVLSWEGVLKRMSPPNAKRAVSYFGRMENLQGIFVRGLVPKARHVSKPGMKARTAGRRKRRSRN